jgi:adenosylmethionine-8-amino-7-oxononanoate aminotransferase
MNNKIVDSALNLDMHNIWHPCTQMKDHETYPPLLIDRGEGIYLFDRDNKRYMDVISSWWVNLFGHNNPRLNKAIEKQLKNVAQVMFAGITHQPAIDLAEKLVKLSPENLTKVFFSDNGSTSVETALKISLQFWVQTGHPEKNKFIYLKGGYHGETLGALSTCGLGLFRNNFERVLMENIEVEGPDCFNCPFGLQRETCKAECFEPMEKTLMKNADRIAGVIVEPLVQGAAGMKMYPPVYLEKLETACEHFNVHSIYDEIAVAFGRTGSIFVSEKLGRRPTFLCLSKGITSGYLPMGATLTQDNIYEAFYDDYSTNKFFVHSHSYTANPLACACANESIDMLCEDGFLESLQTKIDLISTYGEKFKKLKWCGEFRQTGLIAAVHLVKSRETREEFPLEDRVGFKIYQEGLKRGLMIRPLGNVIYFIPPLIITVDEIKTMIDTTYESIKVVLESGS